MLSVISEGTVEARRDAKKLETGKCSDFQKGNGVPACRFPDRECNFTLRQGSQADCKGTLRQEVASVWSQCGGTKNKAGQSHCVSNKIPSLGEQRCPTDMHGVSSEQGKALGTPGTYMLAEVLQAAWGGKLMSLPPY